MIEPDYLFFINTIERRACLNLYRKFSVTNQQVSILSGLSTYFIIHNVRAVQLQKFARWSGAGPAMVRIIQSQARGLLESGALHKVGYKMQPGKFNSVSLSEYGIRLLDAYYFEVSKLSDQYDFRNNSKTYKDVGIHSSKLQETLPMYNIGTKGRDD